MKQMYYGLIALAMLGTIPACLMSLWLISRAMITLNTLWDGGSYTVVVGESDTSNQYIASESVSYGSIYWAIATVIAALLFLFCVWHLYVVEHKNSIERKVDVSEITLNFESCFSKATQAAPIAFSAMDHKLHLTCHPRHDYLYLDFYAFSPITDQTKKIADATLAQFEGESRMFGEDQKDLTYRYRTKNIKELKDLTAILLEAITTYQKSTTILYTFPTNETDLCTEYSCEYKCTTNRL